MDGWKEELAPMSLASACSRTYSPGRKHLSGHANIVLGDLTDLSRQHPNVSTWLVGIVHSSVVDAIKAAREALKLKPAEPTDQNSTQPGWSRRLDRHRAVKGLRCGA